MKFAIIARHMRTTFDQRVEKIGLTGAKWRVLAIVWNHPGATQRFIANMLDITEVTAGRLVDGLCEHGYLERRANPSDRRAYRIFMTRSAKPLLRQLKQLALASEAEALSGLSEDEQNRLHAFLDKIVRNVSNVRNGKDARPARSATK